MEFGAERNLTATSLRFGIYIYIYMKLSHCNWRQSHFNPHFLIRELFRDPKNDKKKSSKRKKIYIAARRSSLNGTRRWENLMVHNLATLWIRSNILECNYHCDTSLLAAHSFARDSPLNPLWNIFRFGFELTALATALHWPTTAFWTVNWLANIYPLPNRSTHAKWSHRIDHSRHNLTRRDRNWR